MIAQGNGFSGLGGKGRLGGYGGVNGNGGYDRGIRADADFVAAFRP